MDSQDEYEIMRAKPMEELLLIALDDQNSNRHVKISSKLNPEDADELDKAFRQNMDVFT